MFPTACFVHSKELDSSGYPDDCPFNTHRAGMAREIVDSMGLLDGDDRYELAPVKATRSELERFHAPDYIDALLAAQSGKMELKYLAMGLGSPDCPIFAGMYDYTALAVGATLTAAREITSGHAHIAFNPSGGFHHANPDVAAGFCYINDVVLGIQELGKQYDKILFLDVDVHHGDGVQDAFYDRSDVMTMSIHETGKVLFPGTGLVEDVGVGEGRGYSVNIPVPVGTYDAAYSAVFEKAALPIIQKFDPDVIVFELGMDGLANDPLAHLNLTNNVYADIVGKVLDLGKPILATGGGGYNPENTARGWALMWSVLCGADDPHDMGLTVGGMMLQNSDWFGGLRDRASFCDPALEAEVNREITAVMAEVRSTLFPLHGIAQ